MEYSITGMTTDQPIAEESRIGDFFALLKPRVMSLVIFSGFAAMVAAPGFLQTHPVLTFTALLALAVNAGAAGAFNMWYERDLDAVMKRTKNRPIPMGRINPDEALTFAVILTLFSVMIMGMAANWLAAGLLAFANFFYVVIYTIWLKPRTPHNIVIGGAAGAFPPMIGWAAITGNLTALPILLFALIFFWTPPHFWALSLFMNDDYKRANIPMLPAVKGEYHTKWQMLIYTILLCPLATAPAMMGLMPMAYGLLALGLSAIFIAHAIIVLNSPDLKHAKRMFAYSIFYLFAMFTGVMIYA